MTIRALKVLERLFIIGILFLPRVAQSDETRDIQDRLNRSDICSTLPEFDAQYIGKLLGYDLPNIPFVDTATRWNKSRHTVSFFEFLDSKFAVGGKLGCQPSGESVIIRTLPVSADDVRLSDNFRCIGSQNSRGRVARLSCSVSGEIGKFIASYIDLDAQIMAALNE